MSLIEGVGDEVLLVFGVVFLLLLISLAWLSTNVRDLPPISVIVLDRGRWQQLLQRLRQTSATIIRIPIVADNGPPHVDQEPQEAQTEASTDTEEDAERENSPNTQGDACCEQTSPANDTLTDGSVATATTVPTQSAPPEASTSDSQQEEQANVDEGEQPDVDDAGLIRVRVKYLDDRQRLVMARPDTTIAQFKRDNFGAELSENLAVRFVYQGQELLTEGATLQGCNITDNSVVHIVLTRRQQSASHMPAPRGGGFDIGNLMLPLFAVILGGVWYCRIVYRQYFSVLATICLGALTFFFGLVFYGSVRARRTHEHLD